MTEVSYCKYGYDVDIVQMVFSKMFEKSTFVSLWASWRNVGYEILLLYLVEDLHPNDAH